MSKVLLITGATGKQGGAVIDALLAQPIDFTILAVTRDVSSASAQKLTTKSPTIKLVQGDLDDVPTLFRTARDAAAPSLIWGVYSVQISMGKGVTVESEVQQGTSLIDAAIGAGVQHFVYSSVERGGNAASWDNETPIPHFQTKYHIEQHLRQRTAPGSAGQTMGWTVLRPVAFMDNLSPGFPNKVFLTALRDTLQGKSLQWVATADIGFFAMQAFAQPEQWNCRAVGLAGDELTFDQMSAVFEKATGSPAGTTFSFFGSALLYMLAEVNTMLRWFKTDGYKADVKELRKIHPQMMDLETWLVEKSAFVSR